MIRVQYDWVPADYFRTQAEADTHITRSNELNPGHDPNGWKIEVVERESRPCEFCGREVQSDKPNVTCCRSCYYGGRSQTPPPEVVAALRALPQVKGDSVGIWHTGGGCFSLGAELENGLEVMCGNDEMDPTLSPSAELRWGISLGDNDGRGVMSETDFQNAEQLVAHVAVLQARWDSGERDY